MSKPGTNLWAKPSNALACWLPLTKRLAAHEGLGIRLFQTRLAAAALARLLSEPCELPENRTAVFARAAALAGTTALLVASVTKDVRRTDRAVSLDRAWAHFGITRP